MSNAKKILESSRRNFEDVVRNPRRKKAKVDFEVLEDVIVGDKLLVPVGAAIAFERYVYGKPLEISLGTVQYIDKDGCVGIWDETREQAYSVKLGEKNYRIRSLLPLSSFKAAEETQKPKTP